ncbi:DUF6506 family protein [Nonomuraea angiospora]|uniref:DUF6506 family protein n=1 Tax=Nonomuraea angiospora TaxID=46172 RepID=UPI003429836E
MRRGRGTCRSAAGGPARPVHREQHRGRAPLQRAPAARRPGPGHDQPVRARQRRQTRFEAGETLSEAFVIVHEGADPAVDVVVHEKADGGRTTFVAVPDETVAGEVAGKMAGELQLIELYGGSGPEGAEPVIRAVDGQVPVGVGAYQR